jgi:HD-GYP domain-containing protein (c-di-GMP phosphodiesterase class II)
MILDSVQTPTHPVISRIHGLLAKIDRLRLPARSRRDVESILVRQAASELDHALPWQQGHGHRTAILAVALGRSAGLAPDDLHHLKLASLLHDIGLLAMPSALLHEPGRWESDGYVALQCHPRIGAELLEPFQFLRKASVIIAHHHERWDGTGYPYGLRGSFIPVTARILAIADAFDAIDVPGAVSQELRDHVAFRIIRVAAGTQFDPSLAQLAERCLPGAKLDRAKALHVWR